MAQSEDMSAQDFESASEKNREFLSQLEEEDILAQAARVYQLWWRWADFELFIINPTIDLISPPVVIPPDIVTESNELEFVYTIHDHGYKLSTSKGQEMYSAGMSMCKLHYTIEKMIYILVERLKSGGVGTETEVQVAFGGHELAQRKAFESVINLGYNVVVTNFDPGVWGERYLQIVKRLADKGYGYPTEAPRSIYRVSRAAASRSKR